MVRLHGEPCSSLDSVTACVVYTANSIRNRIGRLIRFEIRFERKKTIRRSLLITSLFVTLPTVSMLISIFHIGKLCFKSETVVDFIEICNVCARKAIIKDAKRIINSDKMCRSYSDLHFGVTFFGTQCITCT